MKRRIILLGPPASGKGTQAEMLAAKFGFPTASTGALLREQRAHGTALGQEADAWTARGKLFPDEIALRVIGEWLATRGAESFLLDGFPRTLGQAEVFDVQISELGFDLEAVFHLRLDDKVIRERIARRITCAHCGGTFSAARDHVTDGDNCPACGKMLERRGDDTPHALEERLAQHRMHSTPVLEFYRAADKLIEIDASVARDVVFRKLCEAIEGEAVLA